MLTLGFGIKSLLKNPAWAAQHLGNYQRNNPIKPAENENDRYGQNKPYSVSGAAQTDIRAKKGDIDISGINNIFAKSNVGALGENNNIFQMMNKIDESRKPLMANIMPTQNTDPMNPLPDDEKLRKIGKKLNMFM